MGFGINLRGDLAKLNDAELAARLKDAWDRYEAAGGPQNSSWSSRWTFRGWRAPVRHPRVYRFLTIASNSGGTLWLDAIFAFFLSHKKAERPLRVIDPKAAIALDLYEIQDLVDEMERRVMQRQRTTT